MTTVNTNLIFDLIVLDVNNSLNINPNKNVINPARDNEKSKAIKIILFSLFLKLKLFANNKRAQQVPKYPGSKKIDENRRTENSGKGLNCMKKK
jgi:hypothetical protein